jgi:FMN phosphatase YigB (HAD superfamily)
VITNGIARVQHRRLARSGLTDFFAAIVISGEVGIAKPDRRIFDETLTRLGNPARERVLMVGDSLTSDIRGAVDSRIDACWLRPAQAATAASDHGARYEIEHLDEILSIVDE